MKILMACYTPVERDAWIATQIQEKLSCRSEEIKTTGKYTRLKDYLYRVTGMRPEMTPIFNNPGGYDLTIICFSKSSRNLPLPVDVFIKNQRDRFKNIFYLSISEDLDNDGKALEDFMSLAGARPIGMAEISRQDPLLSQKIDKLAGRINEFK
jgi:hypothetical protein